MLFVYKELGGPAAHHIGEVGHGRLNVVGGDRVVTGDAEYHFDFPIFVKYFHNNFISLVELCCNW